MLKLKIKVFIETSSNLEEVYNEWLKKNKYIKILNTDMTFDHCLNKLVLLVHYTTSYPIV